MMIMPSFSASNSRVAFGNNQTLDPFSRLSIGSESKQALNRLSESISSNVLRYPQGDEKASLVVLTALPNDHFIAESTARALSQKTGAFLERPLREYLNERYQNMGTKMISESFTIANAVAKREGKAIIFFEELEGLLRSDFRSDNLLAPALRAEIKNAHPNFTIILCSSTTSSDVETVTSMFELHRNPEDERTQWDPQVINLSH